MCRPPQRPRSLARTRTGRTPGRQEAGRGDRAELVADICERRLHRESEEDDAGHHRQMQVRVDVGRKGAALCAASVDEQLLSAHREEVEVRQPERGRHHEPEERGRLVLADLERMNPPAQ